jgi:hypothetical protein
MTALTPFKIDISDAALADLEDRLRHTVFPSEVESTASGYGPTRAFV